MVGISERCCQVGEIYKMKIITIDGSQPCLGLVNIEPALTLSFISCPHRHQRLDSASSRAVYKPW